MLKDFYLAFASVCFTLLGLWIIVVQTRHAEWRRSAIHRRRAYGVSLHFALPGLMSLLSLVDPASTDLWRVAFAIVAAGGAAALVAVRGSAPNLLGAATYVTAIVLYVGRDPITIGPAGPSTGTLANRTFCCLVDRARLLSRLSPQEK